MKNLLLAALMFSSVAAQAEIRLPSFENLCAYESSCSKAGRVVGGVFQPNLPPPELMSYYARLRPLIIEIAKQYNIDPVTLVLAPLAENTMNVKSYKGKLEATYFDGNENQVDDDGIVVNPALRLLWNAPLSVGPGQIYVYAAKHVEKLAASIEGRPVRTKGKDIKHALYTSEGALRYAAAIMRDAQDIYGAGGIDISHRPEILTSLYNLGKVKEKLGQTLSERRAPAPNYFGFWAGANYRYVQQQLRLPSILDQAQ